MLYLDGKKTAFTPREYELLRYLLLNRGKMLTHKQILKEVWGDARFNLRSRLVLYRQWQ